MGLGWVGMVEGNVQRIVSVLQYRVGGPGCAS